jgi:hypothetical protein
MPDLADLKKLIHDHEAKDAGLTVDIELCLQTWLVDELRELEAEKAEVESEVVGSMAGADTTDVDARIAAKRAEVDAATVLLHFKALTEPKYREVLRDSPTVGEDSSQVDDATFLANLTERSYRGVRWGGVEFTAEAMPWTDIITSLSFGEVDPIYSEVFMLNRQDKSRRPLSSKPSRTNRRT